MKRCKLHTSVLSHDYIFSICLAQVSYQMSEKGPVKVLYSESDTVEERTDREVTKTFNPEAQCFKPVDSLSQQIAGIAVEECPNCTSAPNPSKYTHAKKFLLDDAWSID